MRCVLTLTRSVSDHDSPVLALRARESVVGLGTSEAVLRAGATVTGVEHVLVVARLTDHHVVLLRVDARATVERAS